MEQTEKMQQTQQMQQANRVWQRVNPGLEPYPPQEAGETENFCCMGSAAEQDIEVVRGFIEEELADRIETLGIQGKSHLVFVIGGSIGLGREVLRRSDYALSFSKMTFPHQLMRVILLEQIYRSYRIINGEPYHK